MGRMARKNSVGLTLREDCARYLDGCLQRNLREDTIRHYRQSYGRIFSFFDPDMPLEKYTENDYNRFILHLRETLESDVSMNASLRDLITTMHFLMEEGEVTPFKMKTIKVHANGVETYSEEKLCKLLRKPNIRKCSFSEYECRVISFPALPF